MLLTYLSSYNLVKSTTIISYDNLRDFKNLMNPLVVKIVVLFDVNGWNPSNSCLNNLLSNTNLIYFY